jgi:hypothetical protein
MGVRTRHLTFCIEIDHKHTYKFCVKKCLHVNNYIHSGDGVKC